MHIHKFADIASFAEIGVGGNLPATEEYREFIKKLHPTQFLTGRLTAPLYEVEYSYVTVREITERLINISCCVWSMMIST